MLRDLGWFLFGSVATLGAESGMVAILVLLARKETRR